MESRYGISVDRCRGNDPPSFSSTLLDSICRSFDDSGHDRSLKSGDGCFKGGNSNTETMMSRSGSCYLDRSVRGIADGGGSRDRIVDRWMEKTTTRHEEFVIRRRSIPLNRENSAAASDFRRSLGSVKMKSASTSSSDSSSGFGFSSSDTDSVSGNKKKKSLKPIRTSVSDSETFRPLNTQFESSADEILYRKKRHSDQRPAKCDERKTAKSRAMKIYGELKRIKQPISPGGKVASFLNSLFSAGGSGKKQRISTSMPSTTTIGNYYRESCDREIREISECKSNFTTPSTPSCSTASSYTRSCLSKLPASSGRYGGEKRSVRFSPLSVNVDEELGARGNRDGDLSGTTSRRKSETELTLRVVDNNRKSVEEVAKDLMRNYYKKWEIDNANEMKMIKDQENDEDVESCCSADLFELENLMEIGVHKYSAELPTLGLLKFRLLNY
ncbi:hypothetical protein V2J09_005834 [Rumex salicifolius]